MREKIVLNVKNMNISQGSINNGVVCIGDRNSNNVIVRSKEKAGRKEDQHYEVMEEPYIFISYSHKNIKRVLPIINRMKEDGYRVWYDADIKPGPKWDQYVETFLKHSTIFIGFFSYAYWKSGPCKEEISYACNLAQYESDGIIPVCLDDTKIPDNLGLQMHLSARERIDGYNCNTPGDICRMIYKNALIHKCQVNKEASLDN
ncbi:toll/interleukin-1 receptor domain-containing protein [Blautia sp. OF03-15BH]|uniref:toll/interleukin-1 receptor domain-containing protein n=1 Tax=Blautia sp. OF03-15BH TaxID=2292287 RepID=UPI000E517898|nr:toll/interleukin-1 receptor domain-containing protein [Blautia sp. OF03-15BH]RGX96932.1 toll/interleukin-1 receptor domain-containing protein [Blautia sp. OF03-15BH]